MSARLAILLTLPLILAACGEREKMEVGNTEDSGIFMRDIPEGPAPIDPAPDLADIDPVPDLHADEKALALMCGARGADSPETCGCIAESAVAQLHGRSLAYFVAILIGDEAEAARLSGGLLIEQREEAMHVTERVIRECGG